MNITKHVITKTVYKVGNQEFPSEIEARKFELYQRTRGVLQNLIPSNKDSVTYSELASALLTKSNEFVTEFGKIKRCQTNLLKSSATLKEIVGRYNQKNSLTA